MTVDTSNGTRQKARMSLGHHFIELRKRLLISAAAILAGVIIGFVVSDWIIGAVTHPVAEVAKAHNASLNFGTVTSSFDLRMQIALYTGLVISSPVWLWQIWAFIIPGLT